MSFGAELLSAKLELSCVHHGVVFPPPRRVDMVEKSKA